MNTADRVRLQQWTSQACAVTLICVSVTAPAIIFSSALPYVKVEQLLVPVVCAIYAWLLLIGVARPIRFNGMFVIGFLFCLWNVISMSYGSWILGHTVILRDVYELPKVWLPVAFFTIAYEAELSESSLRRLLAFFSFAVLLVCMYAWGQFLGLGFTYKLNPYYSSGGHIDAALQYQQRVYATVGNANVLGELMTWCLVLFVLASLFRVGSLLRNILVAVSCLITLVMTGSRYGVLLVSIAFLLILLFTVTTGRHRAARVAVLLVLLPVFAWIFGKVAASNRQTIARYQTLEQPLQIDSFRERIEGGWLEAWSDFKSSPLFGHGTAKTFFTGPHRIADSEYLSVLREQGIIGFFIFIGYYLYPLYVIRGGRRAVHVAGMLVEQAPANVVCMYGSLIMGILALIMDIGMSTFYSPYLQGVLWLWLGIGARSAVRLCSIVPMRRVVHVTASHLQPQQL